MESQANKKTKDTERLKSSYQARQSVSCSLALDLLAFDARNIVLAEKEIGSLT